MGSLTSRPKTKTTSADTTSTTEAATTTTTADPEETSKKRAENVLRRSRSTTGTVLTSFRGILSDNTRIPQRKSLLGE